MPEKLAPGFDRDWMDCAPNVAVPENRLSEILEYASKTFDKLDMDGNGYVELMELEEALDDTTRTVKERSFVSFLVNNIEAISDSVDEGWTGKKHAISRQDIQKYFRSLR